MSHTFKEQLNYLVVRGGDKFIYMDIYMYLHVHNYMFTSANVFPFLSLPPSHVLYICIYESTCV